MAVVLLGVWSVSARGDWSLSFSDPYTGLLIDTVEAQAGDEFPLNIDATLGLMDPMQSVFGYALDFSATDWELPCVDYTDAHGWPATGAGYPDLSYADFSNPAVVSPGETLTLGMIGFGAPVEGSYQVAADLSQSGMLPPGFFLGQNPVSVYVSPPGPGAPPVPSPYQMGAVTNGDFEAGGGTLSGWSAGWSGVGLVTLGGDHVAHLHAAGQWVEDWEPVDPDDPEGPWESSWMYENWDPAYIEQTVTVPANATELTFLYYAEIVTQNAPSQQEVYVELGNSSDTLSFWSEDPRVGQWLTFSMPVDDLDKGQEVTLFLEVWDYCLYQPEGGDEHWWEGWPKDEHNSIDFYVDYISLVPEPSAILLLGVGGLGILRRRRN